MSLILNIDTAEERAHVSFAKDGSILHCIYNDAQKEHASFLQSAIRKLTVSTGIKLSGIDAVAVTAGPGSYTGLRVGMASAKGLCYALKKPLITMNTLEVLALSAIQLFPGNAESILFCPMIDARRMEVFSAIYKNDLTICLSPSAIILDKFSFAKDLSENKILFFGSGSEKWKPVCKHENALFENVSILPEVMSKYSDKLCFQKDFTNLAYSEPFYLKEFQTVIKS
ncbi:MAG: tRNA (adenosine(37)-N6)-threonylcarbamoyltransferase complex dimerization subunit type 1 TsaB [Ferruginibacter sp.]